MSEFGGGKTKIRRVIANPPPTESFVPEYSGPTGVVTVTRLLNGKDGEDGSAVAPETALLGYDGDEKLITITKGSGVTTLGYDVDGRLVTVTTPTFTKTLAYAPDGRLESVTVS